MQIRRGLDDITQTSFADQSEMELACRGYMDEPLEFTSTDNWPAPYDAARAAGMQAVLLEILTACIAFAETPGPETSR